MGAGVGVGTGVGEGVGSGEGRFVTDNGSILFVRDLYTVEGGALKIARKTIVETAAEDDLGF